MDAMLEASEKNRILGRLEEIIREREQEGVPAPSVIKDGSFLSTAALLIESIEQGAPILSDPGRHMDYYLSFCEDFFSYGEIAEVLRDFFVLFYRQSKETDHSFDPFVSTTGIVKEHQQEAWSCFLDSMLTDSPGYHRFAMVLFQTILEEMCVAKTAPALSTDNELAGLALRSVLYYSFDSRKICRFMFSLCDVIREENQEEFLKICMEDVYRNYPLSCSREAAEQKDSPVPLKALLARRILERHEREGELQKAAHAIPDLAPSFERHQISRLAFQERNKLFNSAAKKASVFSQLFKSNTLKYGRRSGYIRHEINGKPSYQVSPFVTFRQEYELPSLYVASIFDWYVARKTVMNERSEYIASHHKKLSPDAEREG